MFENILYICIMKDTINGQSAAKLLNSNEQGERSTTIETTEHTDKGVEYINNDGKGRDLIVYIYALADREGIIRYVGKSINPENRYRAHINDKSKSYKSSWLKSIDYKPEMFILDEVNEEDWEFWEIFWINLIKSFGHKLTNLTNGGHSIHFNMYNRDIQEKRKRSLKGRSLSEEHRKKLSESRKGIMFSEEHKKNLSLSHKGLKYNSIKYSTSKMKKLVQLDMEDNIIKIWNSLKEASNYYNVNQSSISHCCAGRKKSIKGFKWRLLN